MSDELMDSSLIGWHQGEVSYVISLLFFSQQFSSGEGSVSYNKHLRNVCQAFIYIFQGTKSTVMLL